MRRFTFTTLLIVLLAACGASGNDSATTETTATTVVESTESTAPESAAPAEEEKPMSEYAGKVAEIQTSKGSITIRFFPEKAPNHVRNFIDLAEKDFYDGTRFHRVIAGFMIQGGDPNTKTDNRRSWGTGGSGTNLAAEFNDTPHRRGIVSMARSSDPNSASSQFFIVVKDSTFLDNQYTVFGEVLEGMDVADAIVQAAGGKENPDSPVSIEDVTVREAPQS